MLITNKNGTVLIKLLNVSGIEASIIGKICESGALLIDDDIEIEVEAPKRDELFNIQ
jgi:hydrogenase expression/formation protein HypE